MYIKNIHKLDEIVTDDNYSEVQEINCYHENRSHTSVYGYARTFFLIPREQVSLKYMQFAYYDYACNAWWLTDPSAFSLLR
jgi:hypothetical protein